MFESILCQVTQYDSDVRLGSRSKLLEGREGRRVGTLFTLGDEDAVLARSRPLLLDPLSGHPESERHVTNLKSARNHQGIVAAGRGVRGKW
jgi:DNA integrity scanning protein DisA with diadenylate cyclase activity